MKLSKSLTLLLGAAAMFAMYGCGSDNRESNLDKLSAPEQASQACIGCHNNDNYKSPVTGNRIVAEWEKSVHSTNANGASCGSCHLPPGSTHPNGGTIYQDPLFKNSTTAPICNNCHGDTNATLPNHYADASPATKAQYMSGVVAAGSKCDACHNPHDTTSLIQYNKDWAESGHGDVAAAAWTEETYNSCATRCHTGTGFITWVSSAGATTPTPQTDDGTMETLYCTACHQDYSWKRRAATTSGTGVATVYTTYDSTASNKVLAAAGDSNLCNNCHAGRGSGYKSVAAANTNSGTLSGPHHGFASETLYALTGYQFANTAADWANYAWFAHDKIGLVNSINGDDISSLGTTRGPCVACHMAGGSHKLEAATSTETADPVDATITAIPPNATTCVLCHKDAHALTVDEMNTLKTDYKNRITALTLALQARGLYYYPSAVEISGSRSNFGNVATPTALADITNNWTGLSAFGVSAGLDATTAAKYLKGSAWNLIVTHDDPAGYVHNSKYTGDLLYDSLDYLDDGLLNQSITAAADVLTVNSVAVPNPWSGIARP